MQRRKNNGFTLAEIMIVVAIVGLLASMAILNFVRARDDTQRTTCVNNMRQIDGAKAQWALENEQIGTATPTSAELEGYVRGIFPVCPSGGIYTIRTVDEAPSCSKHGDFPGT